MCVAGRYTTTNKDREIRAAKKLGKTMGLCRRYVQVVDAVSSQIHQITVTTRGNSQNLCISEKSEENNLLETTQCTSRYEIEQLARCFHTYQMHMDNPMFTTGVWSDTLFFNTNSMRLNVCAKMFCDPLWFLEVFTMNTNGMAGGSLTSIINELFITEFLQTIGTK